MNVKPSVLMKSINKVGSLTAQLQERHHDEIFDNSWLIYLSEVRPRLDSIQGFQIRRLLGAQ